MTDEPATGRAEGRLLRPYAVSNGRTEPTIQLDLMSIVMPTGQVTAEELAVEHARVLGLCQRHRQAPLTVAEVATQMRLPVFVVKVLLSDLIEYQALVDRLPRPADDGPDIRLYEEVLDGLRAL